MRYREAVEFALADLLKKGAAKASCHLEVNRKQEMNIHTGELSLFRTNENASLSLMALAGNKKGSLTINKLGDKDIKDAVEEVVDLAKSSQEDPANDIAPYQEAADFQKGQLDPDLDAMYQRLQDFNQEVRNRFPKIILEEVILDHTRSDRIFLNSNGVNFTVREASYNFVPMFTAKEGKQSSSFNYTYLVKEKLDQDFITACTTADLLQQASEQIVTEKMKNKFMGDLIITPDCIGDFISYITNYLRDFALISQTSLFQDKLGKEVAHPLLTLRSLPLAPEFPQGYFFTNDGFAAQNSTIIDGGVLKSFLLSLYGANKTGLARSVNSGNCYKVEAGETALRDMIAQVDRGLLLCRFSGGNPNDKGDFSGVAKNSYLIEKGTIRYPVSETMISGNLADLLFNIRGISRETVNFGWQIMPWIHFGGVSISGK
ncbi:MAG: TldD/PmbA family protein [Candidatus Cloacimonetes bacterium]|nr:TldD/PmbA family protein [Candidatus Cloacimonadota bacterium]